MQSGLQAAANQESMCGCEAKVRVRREKPREENGATQVCAQTLPFGELDRTLNPGETRPEGSRNMMTGGCTFHLS